MRVNVVEFDVVNTIPRLIPGRLLHNIKSTCFWAWRHTPRLFPAQQSVNGMSVCPSHYRTDNCSLLAESQQQSWKALVKTTCSLSQQSNGHFLSEQHWEQLLLRAFCQEYDYLHSLWYLWRLAFYKGAFMKTSQTLNVSGEVTLIETNLLMHLVSHGSATGDWWLI